MLDAEQRVGLSVSPQNLLFAEQRDKQMAGKNYKIFE
jgi:hypothetical protein